MAARLLAAQFVRIERRLWQGDFHPKGAGKHLHHRLRPVRIETFAGPRRRRDPQTQRLRQPFIQTQRPLRIETHLFLVTLRCIDLQRHPVHARQKPGGIEKFGDIRVVPQLRQGFDIKSGGSGFRHRPDQQKQQCRCPLPDRHVIFSGLMPGATDSEKGGEPSPLRYPSDITVRTRNPAWWSRPDWCLRRYRRAYRRFWPGRPPHSVLR